MDDPTSRARRSWAALAAALLAVAMVLGAVWALDLRREAAARSDQAQRLDPGSSRAQELLQAVARLRRAVLLEGLGVALAAAGAGLMVLVAVGRPASPWPLVAAGAPIVYLILVAAPWALTREALAVVRLLAAAAALGPYVALVWRLAPRMQYGMACGVLGTAALFFGLWDPPPPKAVPIARPLIGLEAELLAQLPGWTGHHQKVTEDIEQALGADEYLNLRLKSPDGQYTVLVFITYNANALSNIPHVPWVCMTQSGYRLVKMRKDDVAIASMSGREIKPNVILFEPAARALGEERALMFQYFNVGGVYESDRDLARFVATSGAIGGKGSYLSQTQVAVWFLPRGDDDPMARSSPVYATGLKFVDLVVPLLEREYYPDLRGAGGG